MMMKLFCLLVSSFVFIAAQETAPEGFQLWNVSSLAQTAQELKRESASNPHHIATRKLADFRNDLYMLAHREADGIVEWHETQADVFVVQSGSSTLLVVGNMVGGETVEPHEKRNGKIEGGTSYKLSAGDVVRIPPKTPHQLLPGGSKEFTYFVIK